MEFTKKQRNEIYRAAYLEYLKEIKRYKDYRWEDESVAGMCYCIYQEALLYDNWNDNNNNLLSYFPEFADLKPDDRDLYNYWWPSTDYSIRKHMFKKIIKITDYGL